jgi:3-vinyl bacteriochlorophyllide hydratase
LHTAYVVAWANDSLGPTALLWLALAAYTSYVVNAIQFVWKLRMARLQQPADEGDALAPSPSRYGRAT